MHAIVERFPLHRGQDVVTARQRARAIAALVGFDGQDQARIATAVSEIARNTVRYAHGGRVEYALEGGDLCDALAIRITDDGPGIAELQAILDGAYRSPHGMGLGILGARRLMDACDVASAPGGTRVAMSKCVEAARRKPMHECIARVGQALAHAPPARAADEAEQQRRELVAALGEARERQEQLAQLNRELEDTNRGVVALYAELDEKAARLRQADEMKSRFLSNVSHEFRTPLNSIRALAGLLLRRVDGPLTHEQARQVELIRNAANDLAELVDDLLDIARIEAGKLEIVDAEFSVASLFSALRGMLRPLVGHDVTLNFMAPSAPALVSDEAKVGQILRNFISNALKFTERGSVTVSARSAAGDVVEFCVEDTGVGIAKADQDRIFEEFVQVEGPLQRRAKGWGLGLPLCRRLAQALGGDVRVESTPGAGSRFFLSLPRDHRHAGRRAAGTTPGPEAGDEEARILIVEDDTAARYAMRRLLEATGFAVVEATTGTDGVARARSARPDAIVLDLGLPDSDGFAVAEQLRGGTFTRDIPVLICTSRALDEAQRAQLAGVSAGLVAKDDLERDLARSVQAALANATTHPSEAA